jgi:protein-S-isoprenylcysteine O-methyltransferase Ste14
MCREGITFVILPSAPLHLTSAVRLITSVFSRVSVNQSQTETVPSDPSYVFPSTTQTLGRGFKSKLRHTHTRTHIKVSFCRLIRHPEYLIGRHWYLPVNWKSFIRWSSDLWVSHCYAIGCDRSFCCALFCVFMTRVSQCPLSLRSEQSLYPLLTSVYVVTLKQVCPLS